MGDGHDFQTKSEVQVLVQSGLATYEEKVVAPRHLETQGSIRDLKRLLITLLILVVSTLTGVITVLATRPAPIIEQTTHSQGW